jgi:hypothetical protein
MLPMKADRSHDRPPRPIRPFLVGITAGALWAGLNVPPVVDAASAAELGAGALAAAIVCGGALALVTEVASVGIRFGRERLRHGR